MPKLIIEIDRNGTLFFILNAFRGAYDKRTYVMAKTAGIDPAEIAEETQTLAASREPLADAVKDNQL